MQKATPLTPMMQQHARAKAEHPDAVVLFRLGDFYEMFQEDAAVGARVLELVLTSREAGKGNRVPMCGVPVHAVETYIARLLHAGYKVAVCEQMEDPRLVRGLVPREVIRVLTPGTVVEESMLEERRNNYLVAISEAASAYGLAALDVSTGEYLATTLEGAGAFEALQTELARLRPAECLLPPHWAQSAPWATLQAHLLLRGTVCDAAAFELGQAQARLAHFLESGVGQTETHTPLALQAAGAILQYLQNTHKTALPHLTCLRAYRPSQYLILDPVTRRNLELVRTMRHGERQGSVLDTLDETITAMGARQLRRWLEQPVRQIETIQARQEAVAELLVEAPRRRQLREALQGIYDIERLLGRIACGTANARQLVALRQSLGRLPRVREALAGVVSPLLQALAQACTGERDMQALLHQAIVDDPPATIRDGGLIRAGYNATLDRLMGDTERHTQWIARLQVRERQRTGIKSLKVAYNQVFGYYIEVSKANLPLVPEHYIRKQTLTNGERFLTDELREREAAILQASEQRMALEYELFVGIRQEIARQAALFQHMAQALAQLDTLASLAEVAALYDYARPVVTESMELVLQQGRHPVVERLHNGFVPNDLRLDGDMQRLLLLTGPNMAGKSTYLRQAALITILAQMGSFVPAVAASIGLVDRIFTRVGAVDDIAAGRSTFMVEMSETAYILQHATPRSLLILDEIGKGTSTFEGLSLAWGVALYIARRLGTRALFATHYHELTALETLCPGVQNWHMAVRETPEGIVFLRQVVRGGASKSYGLHVARLAGLPGEVLDEAAQVLTYLERHGARPPAEPGGMGRQDVRTPAGAPALVQQLGALDICQMTPLQALTVLHQLQQQAQECLQHGRGGI